ncbi:MAG: hypothetical protein KAY50_00785 [Chitinophagaceae bacterium]|nr:hypothetical protein [Chitinophagaceae bacterium]
MQKQLITDQLTKQLEKQVKILEDARNVVEFDSVAPIIMQSKIDAFNEVIIILQSLRQQEVQNVKDAFDDGLWIWNKQGATYSDDYFTQTFEQKGGGNEKE